MKNPPLTTALAAATLFLAPALLFAQPTPEGEAPKPPLRPHQARLDANQDGKVDEQERAAAEKARRDHLAHNPRFLERADTDKDGTLSDNEWEAAKGKLKNMRKPRAEKSKAHRERARGAEFRHGYLLGKFDANGDRKLDKAERAQVRAEGEKRMRAHLEQQLARLKAADTDGDGKFSDTEWTAAKESFQAAAAARRPGKGAPPPPKE